MKKYVLTALVVFALYEIRESWRHRAYAQPDGILVADEPKQTLLPQDARAVLHDGEVLQPLADFQIRARLLSQEKYRFDRTSQLAAFDLCVGWGGLSDNSVIKKLRINQTGRFCFYSWDHPAPVDPAIIMRSLANIHVIPENDQVLRTLKDLRPGQVINLRGQLVRVDYRDGGEWKSSLTRDDTGDGACEIMLVKSLYAE